MFDFLKDITLGQSLIFLVMIIAPGYISWWLIISGFPNRTYLINNMRASHLMLGSMCIGLVNFIMIFYFFFFLILSRDWLLSMRNLTGVSSVFFTSWVDVFMVSFFYFIISAILLPILYRIVFGLRLKNGKIVTSPISKFFGITIEKLINDPIEKFLLYNPDGARVAIALKSGKLMIGDYGNRSFMPQQSPSSGFYFERVYDYDEKSNLISINNLGVWLKEAEIESLRFFKKNQFVGSV